MGTGSEGQPRRSCQLPIALEFRRHVKKEVGEEGKGNGMGEPWVLCLEVSVSLCLCLSLSLES